MEGCFILGLLSGVCWHSQWSSCYEINDRSHQQLYPPRLANRPIGRNRHARRGLLPSCIQRAAPYPGQYGRPLFLRLPSPDCLYIPSFTVQPSIQLCDNFLLRNQPSSCQIVLSEHHSSSATPLLRLRSLGHSEAIHFR